MGLDSELQLLERRARSAEGRLRFNRALTAFARWLPLALVSLTFSMGLAKFGHASPGIAAALGGVTGAVTFGAVAFVLLGVAFRAATRPLPWQSGSLALDRQQNLGDSVTNALDFARIPVAQRSPLMQLCIDEAALLAGSLDPAKAVQVRPPRGLWYCLGLLGLTVLLATLPLHSEAPVTQPLPKLARLAFNPDQDDLQMMREMAEHWQQTNTSVEAQQATRRFNQLLEELAQQKLDKHQVLERLQEIARDLGQPNSDKQQALDEALQGVARALQASAQTKQVASALANKNLPDAEKALRELADKLRHKGAVDRKQLDDLRRALQAAASESGQRQERLANERRQLEESQKRLLHKKGDKELSAAQTQLAQNKRQLEHLDRQQHQAEQGQQEISELDRQLAEAAQRLFEDMGQGADPLQAGAEELSRMSREQMSDQEKQELKKQLEALREQLRQQGNGNQQRQSLLQQFARRARGEGAQGAAAGSGALRPGQGGNPIPLIGQGESKVTQEQPGTANAGNQGQSPAPGNGTDPNLTGESKRLQGKSQDVTAAGIDSGRGPSASSVVHGAAERGFVGSGYKRVYTEYKTVAEEALQHDQIPPGYDAYVRRYFQLIRPRD
jgi:DNA polymerase III delta prime subunit